MKRFKRAGDISVGVVEPNAGRRRAAKSEFPGIATYSNLRDMLCKADVDLATIVTPHNTHAKLVMQCARAKKNVVCEKPMAITTAAGHSTVTTGT